MPTKKTSNTVIVAEPDWFQKKAMKKNATAMNKVNESLSKLDENQKTVLMEIFGDDSNLTNAEKRKLLSGILDAYTTPKAMETRTRYSHYEGKRVPL
jgi:hypothetical protein